MRARAPIPIADRASALELQLRRWLKAPSAADELQRAKADLLLTACRGIQRQMADFDGDPRQLASIQRRIEQFLDRVQAFLG